MKKDFDCFIETDGGTGIKVFANSQEELIQLIAERLLEHIKQNEFTNDKSWDLSFLVNE